jgi:hypothetical protein
MYCRNSRQRQDSHVLRISERSNGLTFSYRHHFLPSIPAANHTHNIPFQINLNAPTRPRIATTQQVRSLIPPISTRTRPSTTPIRRNSSSLDSTKSWTSDLQSRRQDSTMAPAQSLATMPTELQEAICKFVCQEGLRSLMLCNSNLAEVAAHYLYMAPEFASTYRFAQVSFLLLETIP